MTTRVHEIETISRWLQCERVLRIVIYNTAGECSGGGKEARFLGRVDLGIV